MLDSEDEELMKQAKLVGMKQAYPQDSDDTSDFEDMEEEVMMMRDMKQQLQQVSQPRVALCGWAWSAVGQALTLVPLLSFPPSRIVFSSLFCFFLLLLTYSVYFCCPLPFVV